MPIYPAVGSRYGPILSTWYRVLRLAKWIRSVLAGKYYYCSPAAPPAHWIFLANQKRPMWLMPQPQQRRLVQHDGKFQATPKRRHTKVSFVVNRLHDGPHLSSRARGNTVAVSACVSASFWPGFLAETRFAVLT